MTVATLPAGTVLHPLEAHADERGVFTELYRREWDLGTEPVQWNAVWSEAGVLRGVHVHARHDDYLTVPVGRASVGLKDLRRGSPTEGLAALVELGRDAPAALVIPVARAGAARDRGPCRSPAVSRASRRGGVGRAPSFDR